MEAFVYQEVFYSKCFLSILMNVCILDKTGVGAGSGISTKNDCDPQVVKVCSSTCWNSGLNLCILGYMWAVPVR